MALAVHACGTTPLRSPNCVPQEAHTQAELPSRYGKVWKRQDHQGCTYAPMRS